MQERILGGALHSDLSSSNRFEGTNPELRNEVEKGDYLEFDSKFESGNLDRVVVVSPKEYDLYMRSDTNMRGHH